MRCGCASKVYVMARRHALRFGVYSHSHPPVSLTAAALTRELILLPALRPPQPQRHLLFLLLNLPKSHGGHVPKHPPARLLARITTA